MAEARKVILFSFFGMAGGTWTGLVHCLRTDTVDVFPSFPYFFFQITELFVSSPHPPPIGSLFFLHNLPSLYRRSLRKASPHVVFSPPPDQQQEPSDFPRCPSCSRIDVFLLILWFFFLSSTLGGGPLLVFYFSASDSLGHERRFFSSFFPLPSSLSDQTSFNFFLFFPFFPQKSYPSSFGSSRRTLMNGMYSLRRNYSYSSPFFRLF